MDISESDLRAIGITGEHMTMERVPLTEAQRAERKERDRQMLRNQFDPEKKRAWAAEHGIDLDRPMTFTQYGNYLQGFLNAQGWYNRRASDEANAWACSRWERWPSGEWLHHAFRKAVVAWWHEFREKPREEDVREPGEIADQLMTLIYWPMAEMGKNP